jgi:hypothetical protein
MISTEKVMNTTFKANPLIVNKFADLLFSSTDPKCLALDGAKLDEHFSFALMLTYCDKCRENHWFVAFSKHGEVLKDTLPETDAIDVIPIKTFEEAVDVYQDMNDSNEQPKH